MLRNSRVLSLCALVACFLLLPALGLAQTAPAAPAAPPAVSTAAPSAAQAQQIAATPDLAALLQKPVRTVVSCNQYACGHGLLTNCTQVCGDAAFCYMPSGQLYGHCIYQ
jgi:hypothetical protein